VVNVNWFKAVTVLGASVALVAAGIAPATASLTGDRAEQYRYAEETLNLSYTQFVARKSDFEASGCRVDRPKPGGCTKPAPYNSFDWTDDGCSGIQQIGFTSNLYRNLFNKPCQLHDFGYRNFGTGLILERTEVKRAEIDNRFRSEMVRLCNNTFTRWWQKANKVACVLEAGGVYSAVRVLSNWTPPPPPPPRPPPPPVRHIFTVMNTSETLPDGVWFRNSPHTADTSRIIGLGIYANEQVNEQCYAWGDAVGAYANSLWYYANDVSRPYAPNGATNVGWLNAHYINDGTAANQPVPGVPAC